MKQIDQEIGAATSPQVLRRVNARRVLEHAWRTGAAETAVFGRI